jgi:hypothetical protein
MKRHASPRRCAALAVALVVVALAACAPDAVTNKNATGFNAYLGQIATACKPLMIGSYDMSYQIQRQGIYDDDYNYFLDVTSRLYYQRMTAVDYRSAINGFFGAGATTDRGIECIIANLPADRPQAAPPLGGLINVN